MINAWVEQNGCTASGTLGKEGNPTPEMILRERRLTLQKSTAITLRHALNTELTAYRSAIEP
jgi:hypothetical protein